jgi:hypothetical protein
VAKAWSVPQINPSASLAENARRILAVRIGEYYSYAPIVDDERQMEALHNLRIAAKRLRYTLELFRSVFGEIGERLIDQVKEIQELLGQLHDHDVRIALIEDELAKLAVEQTAALGRTLASSPTSAHEAIATAALRPPPDDPRRGLLALLGRQYTSRHDVFERFHKRWQEFAAQGMRAELVRLSAMPLPVCEDQQQAETSHPEAM